MNKVQDESLYFSYNNNDAECATVNMNMLLDRDCKEQGSNLGLTQHIGLAPMFLGPNDPHSSNCSFWCGQAACGPLDLLVLDSSLSRSKIYILERGQVTLVKSMISMIFLNFVKIFLSDETISLEKKIDFLKL